MIARGEIRFFSNCSLFSKREINTRIIHCLLRQGDGDRKMYTFAVGVVTVRAATLTFFRMLAFARVFFTKIFLFCFGSRFLFAVAFFRFFVAFSACVSHRRNQHESKRDHKQQYGKSPDHLVMNVGNLRSVFSVFVDYLSIWRSGCLP